MLTINIKTTQELIANSSQLVIYAREFRFWDHYITINTGEYGKRQRELYKNKVDGILKKIGLTAEERRETLIEITQSKETF